MCPEIKAAFERASNSGSYDEVKRFNGKATVLDKAYAMSNHKEYFAGDMALKASGKDNTMNQFG